MPSLSVYPFHQSALFASENQATSFVVALRYPGLAGRRMKDMSRVAVDLELGRESGSVRG